MSRRRVLAVLAGLVVLAGVTGLVALGGGSDEEAPPAPPPALPHVHVGVVANALDDDAPRIAARVRAARIGWMREELRWSEVEPERGRFTFARYDALVATLARQGIRLLPLLIESPRWMSADPRRLPTSLVAWQGFVGRAVGRYGRDGTFWRAHPELDASLAPTTWEVWNEPYLEFSSPPAPDPARYAELVRATAVAGRHADPAASFLAAVETTYTAADGSVRNWTRDLFTAIPDLARYVDGLAVHPYSNAAPMSTDVPRVQRFGRMTDIQADLADLGVPPKPVWLTEIGWSTCANRPPCITEGRQARYLSSALALVAATPAWRVRAVFVYRLGDLRGTSDDPQAAFGVVRTDGQPKAAYDVLREAAAGAE